MSITRCMFLILICTAGAALAHGGDLPVTQNGEMFCITSEDTPNVGMGRFPNRANPNAFAPQTLTFCFDATPQVTGQVVTGLPTTGVTLSGIPIRPFTAGYYDADHPRGVSDDPSSWWRQQAMYAPVSLGMDNQNGHVDRSGLYHYHAVSSDSLTTLHSDQLGYAPDGFAIRYAPDIATSSWVLRSGTRASPPFGAYDGTYEEDFEFKAGAGTLDASSGATVNGIYTYFATDTYPYFPRCFVGAVNPNFMTRR